MKKRYLIAGACGLAAGAAVTAKLLRRPSEVVWDEHSNELPHAGRSSFAEVEGARVHYQEAGSKDAPPLILIHGFCASTYVWREVFLPLAERGFRVIVPDLLGYGYSDRPRAGEYTLAAQARMVVGLLDILGIEKATLVGSSYGGGVAATVALDDPSRVTKLILIGAVSNNEPVKQPLARLATAPVVGDLVMPFMLDSRSLYRWRQKKKILASGSHLMLDEERVEAHHRPLRAASAHRAVLRTLRNWSADRIEQEAHRITQPTLLIWGENDLEIPLRHGEHLQKMLPNARLVVMRRCGHLPQEEYPQEFIELVSDFCVDANKIEEQQAEVQMSGT